MQNRSMRSELELGGPRSGLKIGPRSSGGEGPARLSALIPNLTMSGVVLRVPRGFRGGSERVPR
eukprot:608493-Alexandrium_andersonii.AAC.1